VYKYVHELTLQNNQQNRWCPKIYSYVQESRGASQRLHEAKMP